MRLPPWLRHAFARPRQTTRKPHTRRLELEQLEARENPSGGMLVPTFGVGGIVNFPNATDNGAIAVAVQPDGKVVVAGEISGSKTSITVQRLNTDGTLDRTFNKTGSLTIQTGKGDFPNTVVLQPDGKILIGGGALANNGSSESLVARVNTNGTLDSTFGSKGLWVSAGDQVQKLVVLTDPLHPGTVTGIVAAAQGTANGVICYEAIKLTPSGSLDTTFGSGGFTVLAGVGSVLNGMAVDPSGEIYLDGEARVMKSDGSIGTVGCIAAVTPGGALDTSFGSGSGFVLADPSGNQPSHFYDMAVQTLTVSGQTQSRLVVAGTSSDGTGQTGLVTAYTLGGSLDTSFAVGGSFVIDASIGRYPSVSSLALEADGSIVVGGYEYYLAGDGSSHTEMLVGHLTADGTADTSFGSDGTGFVVLRDGLDSRVWGLAVTPSDGDILAVGYSISKKGAARQGVVARFTSPL